jgi:uncharacterized protein YPO0396
MVKSLNKTIDLERLKHQHALDKRADDVNTLLQVCNQQVVTMKGQSVVVGALSKKCAELQVCF